MTQEEVYDELRGNNTRAIDITWRKSDNMVMSVKFE